MKGDKALKIIGMATTIVGAVASVVGAWVSDKQLDNKIAEKLNEAIADSTKES